MRALLRRPHIRRRGYAVRRRDQAPTTPSAASLDGGQAPATPLAGAMPAPDARPAPGLSQVDLAAHRVRAAGGPTDIACYQCACGYVFDAAVTTSVHCPHCGSEQAW
jgi:hypothetical protein